MARWVPEYGWQRGFFFFMFMEIVKSLHWFFLLNGVMTPCINRSSISIRKLAVINLPPMYLCWHLLNSVLYSTWIGGSMSGFKLHPGSVFLEHLRRLALRIVRSLGRGRGTHSTDETPQLHSSAKGVS